MAKSEEFFIGDVDYSSHKNIVYLNHSTPLMIIFFPESLTVEYTNSRTYDKYKASWSPMTCQFFLYKISEKYSIYLVIPTIFTKR